MDSRFYKKENAKYILYPQEINFYEILNKIFVSKNMFKNMQIKMNNMISGLFNVDSKDITYYSSASQGLKQVLSSLVENKKIKNVYIPDFSCTELADAIISANCNLKVYNIEENLKPSIETLEKISKDKDGVLILTSLFGKNTYSEEYVKILKCLNIPIILDEAQAFPNISLRLHNSIKKCAILVSFGKSKPILGIGGGAIINKGLISSKTNKINEKNYFKDIFKISSSRIKNGLIKINVIKKQMPKYKSLEELLTNRKCNENEVMNKNISKLEFVMAYSRLKKYIRKYKKRTDITNTKIHIYGDKKLKDYNYLPIISDNRYEVMKKLGKKGVQCTIYYYPLHLNQNYSGKYNLDQYSDCENIFKNIIIVPFSIEYSNNNLRKILKIIESI